VLSIFCQFLITVTHNEDCFKMKPASDNSLTPMGSGGNKKNPPRRIPTVGIVLKVLPTRTQLTHKHHHLGGAVRLSYGVVSLDTPNSTRVTFSKGVG
jgi:hypothetical protein